MYFFFVLLQKSNCSSGWIEVMLFCRSGRRGCWCKIVSFPWSPKVASGLRCAVLLGQLVGISLFSFFPQVLEKVSSLLTWTYSCISACRIVNAILTFPMLKTRSGSREESKTQDKLLFFLFLFPLISCLQTKLGNLWKILADHLKIN